MTETGWYAPNQQAVRADGSGPAEEGDGGSTAPEQQQQEPAGDLDALTKDELLDEAEARDLDVSASMTKAEIRQAIEDA